MDCEEGPSSSAQSRASRSARCPVPVPSLLGGRISRMRGPLPRLGITFDDPEHPGGAVGPDIVKTDEGPRVSSDGISEARSISTVGTIGMRFNSEMTTSKNHFDFNARLSEDSPISSPDTAKKPGGGLRFASQTEESEPLEFVSDTYVERYSEQSDFSGVRMTSSPDIGNCKRPVGRTVGRDTMGFNFFVSGLSRCPEDTTCYEECGYGTGCDAQCSLDHGIKEGSNALSEIIPQIAQAGVGAATGGAMPVNTDFHRDFAAPGGPQGYPGGLGPRGYTGGHPDGRYRCPEDCGPPDNHGSGQLNFYVMLLLEVFGVLIFFAICTITFWITLAYHFIRLLVELKNADRSVQVAVAIVFGLLFLAFAICHVTHGSSCRSPDRSRDHWTRAGSCGHRKPKAKSKSTSPITMVFTQIKKALSFGGGSSSSCSSCGAKKASSSCGAKKVSSSCKAKKASSSCGAKKASAPCRHRKTRYSDCEGRAIFISSRRYAIPTEMKQPPTIVLWLLNVLGRFMSQQQ